MTSKIKIFLASSNELHNERNEVSLFIAKENKHLIRSGVFLELVLWEDLQHSFKKNRIQDYFNHEMLKCDIVIALFYTKVGNFTKEEFLLAYNNLKKGKKPYYLYAYFKETNISMSEMNIEFLEEYKNIKYLQKEIEKSEQVYCKFKNVEELKNLIKSQIEKCIEPILELDTNRQHILDNNNEQAGKIYIDKTNFGPILFRMCNRDSQFKLFRNHFIDNYKKNFFNTPQFYVLHGLKGEAHTSFIERLRCTIIHSFVKTKLNQKSKPYFQEVEWPNDGDLDSLLWNLLTAFDPDFFDSDYSLSKLLKMKSIEKYNNNIVIISHVISEKKWNSNLIQSYINSFWLQTKDIKRTPLFLIFFNVEYSIKKNHKKILFFNKQYKIEKELPKIKNNILSSSNFFLINKLQSIQIDHVIEWFERFKVDIDEKERKKVIDLIFQNGSSVNMQTVEKELKKYTK